MGFLKLLNVIWLLLFLLISGCAASLIKTAVHKDNNPYSTFGKTSAREFFINDPISDSLQLKWENDVNGSFDNSSVVITDSLVFINDLSGRVFCFRLNDGKRVGQIKNDGAVFTSPYIDKYNIIYVAADDKENTSHLKYYNFSEGKIKHDIEVKGRCVTQIIGFQDGIIFNTENGNVYRYDLNGNEVWQTKTSSVVHSSPSMNNNIIIFGNDVGEILGIDADNGKILYKKQTGESFFGGSCISGTNAYIGNDNGILYCIDIHTGEVVWDFDSHARIVMVPNALDSKIYFGNLNGDLFCLNKSDGNLIWKSSTDGILDATPYAAENFLVVPDLNKKFYLVNINNGEIEKTFMVDGRTKLSPVIFKNLLFIGFDKGELQAYEFK
jgi:outer membrane protein assembly factor BamB